MTCARYRVRGSRAAAFPFAPPARRGGWSSPFSTRTPAASPASWTPKVRARLNAAPAARFACTLAQRSTLHDGWGSPPWQAARMGTEGVAQARACAAPGAACHCLAVAYTQMVKAFEDVYGSCKPFAITGSLPCIAELQDEGYDVQVCARVGAAPVCRTPWRGPVAGTATGRIRRLCEGGRHHGSDALLAMVPDDGCGSTPRVLRPACRMTPLRP